MRTARTSSALQSWRGSSVWWGSRKLSAWLALPLIGFAVSKDFAMGDGLRLLEGGPFANTGLAKNGQFAFQFNEISFSRFDEFSNPRSRPVSF